MYSSMDKLKKALSGDDEEDKGIVTQISDASTLSWSTRIKGFIICFALGATLSILGSCLFFISSKGPIIFGVLYTVGNLLSIMSTCFLMGPCNQLKKMFAPTRIFATILVFVMLVLTLVCAFAVKIGALVIICCVLQFLALTWYSLSYIPFARDAAKKCFAACLD
ncbi:vesicle transport protein SFT2B-like isoform X2 [Physella acuta]|uniref:vesicle transport protein SFT2B-like isoform X2 n=1 Tax=Physella acuta TaxID=109671 RepID=UPI0027DE2A3A|nr:vesicle transport protein SFT2B-like isoform X2 [Physella acuta]